MSHEKIKLILMNNTAYVWNSEDWLRIRSLRIVGNLIGSLAAMPKQHQMAGLPLALLKEETTLLLEKGYGILKCFPKLSEPPNKVIQEESSSIRQKLLSEQAKLLLRKRKIEIESNIDLIIKGKKAKGKYTYNPESSAELEKDIILEEEFKKIASPNEQSLVIQVPTGDPWLQNEEMVDCVWNYPSNDEENLRYSIFKDLWELKYFITPGGKFGGDFLVYLGDPIKFHASFIIICVHKDKKIGMNEIITYGRLGQSVKKTVAFAFLEDDKTVNYQSVQWAGF